jgi:class 3 adenylate cyclase
LRPRAHARAACTHFPLGHRRGGGPRRFSHQNGLRADLHTGEFALGGDYIEGLAISIGARVVSLAGPNEGLVSSVVKDLVAGSGLSFEDRGTHALKGVPGSGGSSRVGV